MKSALPKLAFLIFILIPALAAAYPDMVKDGVKKTKWAATNIRLTEEGDDAVVCYDLDHGPIARVTLVGKSDGEALDIRSVSGDEGVVFGPAKDLCIRWKVREDYPEGLDEKDVTLDLRVDPFDSSPVAGDARTAPADMAAVPGCVREKLELRFKSEREQVSKYRADYIVLYNAAEAPWRDMVQKLRGGIPVIKRYERDRDGRTVPVYDYEELSEREKDRIKREIERHIDKYVKNPAAVLSHETRRAKERYEDTVKRYFTVISSSCESETGIPSPVIQKWIEKNYGPSYILPEPFHFLEVEMENWSR